MSKPLKKLDKYGRTKLRAWIELATALIVLTALGTILSATLIAIFVKTLLTMLSAFGIAL